jgi:hypothetical protein
LFIVGTKDFGSDFSFGFGDSSFFVSFGVAGLDGFFFSGCAFLESFLGCPTGLLGS